MTHLARLISAHTVSPFFRRHFDFEHGQLIFLPLQARNSRRDVSVRQKNTWKKNNANVESNISIKLQVKLI